MFVSVENQTGTYTVADSFTVAETGDAAASSAAKGAAGASVPEAASLGTALLDEKAPLKAPAGQMSMAAISSLSSEAIMSLLGFEERKTSVESGKAALEAHHEERAAVNQERIEKLQEQSEKLKSQGLLDKIKQAFQILGCILGAIAGIAAAVVGFATGNPLMVLGAGMALLCVGDQMTQAITGGEKGITQAIVECAKKNNDNQQAAAIAAQVMMFVIGIAGAVLSGGVGSSVQALSGTARTLNVGINALTGFNSICTGSVGIASSVVNYQIENLRADSKDLEAILMRIQTASDLDSKNIEDILKKCENMSQSVREVLDSCNQALGAVVTAAPSMA